MGLPDWLMIVSAVVSPTISIGAVVVSWRIYSRQKADAKVRTMEMQESLAASLLTDVLTAKAGFESVLEQSKQLTRISILNSQAALLVLRGLTTIRMPTVDTFKTQIASFEPSLADPILQASSCIERVRHLVEGFVGQSPGIAELAAAITGVREAAPNGIDKLEGARRALVAAIAKSRKT